MKKTKSAKHFLKDTDLTAAEVREVLALSADIKQHPEKFRATLNNKTAALLFEKLSLRTKFTLQIGVHQMGGFTVVNDGRIPDREPVKDIARNLARWVNVVVARVYSQEVLEDLAGSSPIPVVNALSDRYHPCQILADMLTLQEHFGKLAGLKLAFIGDGNNVANSLMLTCARLGVNFAIATPPGFAPDAALVKKAASFAKTSRSRFLVTNSPQEAAKGADAVYTDTWVSMGQEGETEKRLVQFKNYQVNNDLFRHAKKHAVFMHCLPKHPDQEVSQEVFESKRSVVFEQAENRLHTIKGLLVFLMQGGRHKK